MASIAIKCIKIKERDMIRGGEVEGGSLRLSGYETTAEFRFDSN